MCPTSKNERNVNELLRDPLIRLVMDSDGVTEQAMIGVLEHLRIALAARKQHVRARQDGVVDDRRAHKNFLQRSGSLPMKEGWLERAGGYAPDGNIVNSACGNQPGSELTKSRPSAVSPCR